MGAWAKVCIALHCFALLGIAWTALHGFALLCIALPCNALLCIALPSSALLCIVLHCIALHGFALHCIALHGLNSFELYCIALHCFALHCCASRCIALSPTLLTPNPNEKKTPNWGRAGIIRTILRTLVEGRFRGPTNAKLPITTRTRFINHFQVACSINWPLLFNDNASHSQQLV